MKKTAFLIALIMAVNVNIAYAGGARTEERVHFIDVGQGDSALVESNGLYMLIDAGEENDGDTVKEYLEAQGVDKLTYVIATHPHADHIGGMDDVINAYEVENVIMPRVSANTKCFENFLLAVKNSKANVIETKVGQNYTLGDFSFTIIGPSSYTDDGQNNNSAAIKLVNKNDSFIMTGDAEQEEEADILATGIDISADVLKAGHHGSKTSTSDMFLAAVKPKYCVISVGEGNSYGHPADTTLEKLNAIGAKVYRTDIDGTVVAESSGDGITFGIDEEEEAQGLSDKILNALMLLLEYLFG